MDTSKQRQTSADEDTSDDLIAELARLVAQDAKPGNAGASPRRAEPGFSAERAEPAVEAEPHVSEDSRADARDSEPDHSGTGDDVVPVFDFGFGTAHKVAQAERETTTDTPVQRPEHDPIADLIAGAEAEQFAADRGEEAGDLFEAPPVAAPSSSVSRTEPDMAATAYSSGRRDAVATERDPLSEIEALIGEAARVSAGGRRVRSAFLDDDQDPQAIERAVDMAEDSIRVAKEARNWDDRARQDSEPPMPDLARAEFSAGQEHEAFPSGRDEEPEHYTTAASVRPRRRAGGVLIPALAGAVIFALLGGGYVLFFSPQQETGEPPVLTAEAGPLKEEPEESAAASTASDSVVFNEMSGAATSEGEALVSRDETGGVTGNAVSNLITSEDGVGELVNRSVRTVTVRPDGTIVNSDDGVAGGSVLPVDRPNVPILAGNTAGEDPIGDAIVAAIGGDTAADPASATADTTAPLAETTEAAVEALDTSEAQDASAGVEDPNAPQPIPRPEGLVASDIATPSLAAPASGGGQAETVAAADTPATLPQAPTTTTAPTQPEVASAAPASGGSAPAAWVQLASQRSEEVARAGASELQARYGPLFSGAVPEVSRVDLGERGIYYRVRLPQPTLADANAVCDAIKGQGGDCFVLNN